MIVVIRIRERYENYARSRGKIEFNINIRDYDDPKL